MDRQLLARATEGTDAPTPGYLYVDLAKQATSNPMACQEMANYLINRLQNKQNPNIKWKCCKVIAKLADQVPRNAFRRCLSSHPTNTAALKEALNFRGNQDPVNGDAPNQRVRTAAKEALDAIYAESASSQMQGPMGGNASAGMGMTGIGSNSYGGPVAGGYGGGAGHGASGSGGGGGGGSGGPRHMEGIGSGGYNHNNRQQYQQPNTNLKQAVAEAGSVLVAMVKDPLARNHTQASDVPRQGHSGNLPGYGGPTYGRPPPGATELSRQTGGQWTMASNRGPGAITPAGAPPPLPPNSQSTNSTTSEEYYKQRDSSFQWAASNAGAAHGGGVGGSWASASPGSIASQARQQASSYNHGTPSVTVNHGPSSFSSGGGGTAVSDGTYERSLIMELCPAGGMKAVPPPDKLANFRRSAPSLNPDLICPVLLDCLEEGQPWIIRAKALCVMEVCIQSGGRSDGANAYRDFFFACQEEVKPMASHPRAAIKEPARRILELLGVEGGTVSAGPAAAAPAAPAPNLLDFDDDAPAPQPSQPPPPPPTAPPPPPSESVPRSGGSMFGGMQVKSKGTSSAPAATSVAAAPASGNLLDFMADSAAAAAAAAPATANSDGDIIFHENGDAAPSSASMFAQMNIKEEDKKTESEDAGDLNTMASNGSSAFGFINQTSSSGTAEDAPPVPPPAQLQQHQSSQSFDPLMNLTSPGGTSSNMMSPNSQRQMMQMSPEQMQAMAYQQMRMQAQRQQQQMQSAYMQHAAAGGGRPGPMPPMYPSMGASGNVMGSNSGGAASNGFSFMDSRPVARDDKKFDFVKDAMQSANKK